jgi:hypothetical protein
MHLRRRLHQHTHLIIIVKLADLTHPVTVLEDGPNGHGRDDCLSRRPATGPTPSYAGSWRIDASRGVVVRTSQNPFGSKHMKLVYSFRVVPVQIDGKLVFSIGEALREAAISRATFFRWVKEGVIHDTEFRDRNGRRVFTADEVDGLKRFAHKLVAAPQLRFPLPRPR